VSDDVGPMGFRRVATGMWRQEGSVTDGPLTSLTKPRPRVLVVEDTADVRDVLRDSLTQLGCDVVTVSDADEAVSRFRERMADLLVTDLSMPGVSGWGLITTLVARQPRLPVIVITGTGISMEDPRCQEFSVTLLRKPFTLTDLAAAVALAMVTRKWRTSPASPSSPGPRRKSSRPSSASSSRARTPR
jgi:two-component system, NarL family, capsular synthesis sensor histidine kinase RcsC